MQELGGTLVNSMHYIERKTTAKEERKKKKWRWSGPPKN